MFMLLVNYKPLFYIVTNQHHNEKLILLGLNRLAPNEHVCIISCNISANEQAKKTHEITYMPF